MRELDEYSIGMRACVHPGGGTSVHTLSLLSYCLESRALPRLGMARAEPGAIALSCTNLLGKPRQAWVWAEEHTGGEHCGHPQALPLEARIPMPGPHAKCAVAFAGGDVSYYPHHLSFSRPEGQGADEKVGSHRDGGVAVWVCVYVGRGAFRKGEEASPLEVFCACHGQHGE